VWVLLVAAADALAGTTGSVAGRVVDQNQKPVVAATIVLVGQRLGAYTDAEGLYRIARVPPGTYELTVSRLSYESVRTTGIVVSADQTTTIDLQCARPRSPPRRSWWWRKRPPVDLKQTSTQANVAARIQGCRAGAQDVVNLQARRRRALPRGRVAEVQYQVDGVA
jgi:hypothetical protein